MNNALLLFAKQPVPGAVKTRLSPAISAADAAELYGCMLADTVAVVAGLQGTTLVLCYAPAPGAAAYFRENFPTVQQFPQEGDDLGERLSNAFALLFARGFTAVAAIGSDAPHVPPAYLAEAFRLVATAAADVVFGPADDGGYYLVAMPTLHSRLFRDIPWSCQDTLAASEAVAADLGLQVRRLPLWHDLDTVQDLQRLLASAVGDGAVRTRQLLRKLFGNRLPLPG
jgi:uncharacterized protein